MTTDIEPLVDTSEADAYDVANEGFGLKQGDLTKNHNYMGEKYFFSGKTYEAMCSCGERIAGASSKEECLDWYAEHAGYVPDSFSPEPT